MRTIKTNISFIQSIMIIMLSTGLLNHALSFPSYWTRQNVTHGFQFCLRLYVR
ncbi:hypothetical protein NST74_14700 [Paenibacillus sp. FSL F4-0125]|uniref:hypothetical protein n=1 Tax=Paenibacillus sp. FSL F4-0125 TaxID=2954730 RepID=UPI0030F5E963